jgi:peroxiredoxin
MRSSILLFAIVLSSACNQAEKPSETTDLVIRNDTLVYEELLASFDQRYAKIDQEYDGASQERQEELELAYEQVELDLVEAQKGFIKSYPNSAYCLPILWEIDWSFSSAGEFRDYLELIEDSQADPENFARLATLVEQMGKVEPGQVAPDFEMEDTDGNRVRLSDTYSGAAYLLLDFWASTCGPCRTENLIIRKAYDRFHGQGFDVLGVSTDARKESWLEAIKKDGLIWTNLCSLQNWNENEIVKTYALRQVSQNFLLDSSGNILATNLRGDALLSTLEELLN